MKIQFNNYFTEEEKEKVRYFIECYMSTLPKGMHYSVDVSDVVRRTANVDVEVEED